MVASDGLVPAVFPEIFVELAVGWCRESWQYCTEHTGVVRADGAAVVTDLADT
jgi:hypothetical protein